MHAIHHTEGFIIKSMEAGEANKRVWLFTREFGLIVATVQGVRKQGAKLQMHLVDYSLIHADIIRGKDVWRLVSVSESTNPIAGNITHTFARGYVRTLTLLARFLVGEDGHTELFEHLEEVLAYVQQTHEGDKRAFDTLSLWRALALLGYIAGEEDDAKFLELSFAEAMKLMDEGTTKRFIMQSNEAVAESQL